MLGASSYTYVEALESQSLPCWIEAHVRALEFIGGVPMVITPDNLKAGVTKPHYYDPDINTSYQEFACHYCQAPRLLTPLVANLIDPTHRILFPSMG